MTMGRHLIKGWPQAIKDYEAAYLKLPGNPVKPKKQNTVAGSTKPCLQVPLVAELAKRWLKETPRLVMQR